jgi:hypothetical protein
MEGYRIMHCCRCSYSIVFSAYGIGNVLLTDIQLVMIADKAQLHSMFNNHGLEDTINHLQTTKRNIVHKMNVLKQQMRQDALIDQEKLSEFLQLNKDLRVTKIWEAEFAYLKNIL